MSWIVPFVVSFSSSLCLLLSSHLISGSSSFVSASVPDIYSMSIEWLNMPVRSMPVVQNFYGAATLRRDVQPGFGLISLGPITSAPFNGNFQNSTFRVNGLPWKVHQVTWGICEALRETDASKLVYVKNTVRLPFEQHGFMQTWEIKGNKEKVGLEVEMLLDGPFYRQCDAAIKPDGHVWSGCGWGTSMPIDRENFLRSIVSVTVNGNYVDVMMIEDTLSKTVAVSAVWIPDAEVKINLDFNAGFQVISRLSYSKAQVYQAASVDYSRENALQNVLAMMANFDQVWTDACAKWDERWKSAFDPNGMHFSGHLPIMKSNNPKLDKLYYWSALALISLERTNLKTFPRQFVISEGPSNSLDGGGDMGGTGQFVWDLSFSSISISLLEPKATSHLIKYLIKYSKIKENQQMMIPQAWDAYIESQPGIGGYCFDYIATFFLIHQYISMTSDTALLNELIPNFFNDSYSITPLEYMEKLAWTWKRYPKTKVSEFLVDYGNDKRSFLEAVPTYKDAVPALQASNAAMLLSMAQAFERFGGKSQKEIDELKETAQNIMTDLITYQYNEGKGFFNCIFDNGTAVEVRAIADFIYSGLSLGVLTGDASLIPISVRKEMSEFFMNEMLTNGWIRALSLKDPVMSNVYSESPGVEDLLAMRADWTGTGAYGGLSGSAIDSLVDLEGGFVFAMQALENISLVATSSMPAQGIAVMTPPYMAKFLDHNDGLPVPNGPFAPAFPEFFDELYFPPWWPNTARSIQNSEAAITDCFIRSIFGWRPVWNASRDENTEEAITRSLHLASSSRGAGFKGTLLFVKTPYGNIDIEANQDGLSWSWSKMTM